jgi:hypothetical protein
MGVRLNRETTLEHLPLHSRVLYECRNKEIIVLFEYDLEYYVASFNKYGTCTNGSSFDRDKNKAWKFFTEIIQEDLETVRI